MNDKLRINKYLYYEYGFHFDGVDESLVTEEYPYKFTQFGVVQSPKWGELRVYTFGENNTFYAYTGGLTGADPLDGFSLEDLQFMFTGEHWLETRGVTDDENSIYTSASFTSDQVTRFKAYLSGVLGLYSKCKVRMGAAGYIKENGAYILQYRLDGKELVTCPNGATVEVPAGSQNAWTLLCAGTGKLLEENAL